jgi:hypothetical protein
MGTSMVSSLRLMANAETGSDSAPGAFFEDETGVGPPLVPEAREPLAPAEGRRMIFWMWVQLQYVLTGCRWRR